MHKGLKSFCVSPCWRADGGRRGAIFSDLCSSQGGARLDCQAALYWLARLLTAGEDPLYLARRIIRMSIEDVGLADPQALSLALSAQECYRALGSPEGELGLAEVVLYLALAPKSASAYVAFDKASRHCCRDIASYASSPYLERPNAMDERARVFKKGMNGITSAKMPFLGRSISLKGWRRRAFLSLCNGGLKESLRGVLNISSACKISVGPKGPTRRRVNFL